MDLSDIGRLPAVTSAAGHAPDASRHPIAQRWPDLVARIGVEIAGPLTTALERINSLTHSGTIDRAGLRALREEVEAARLAGIVGQQLTRFVAGRMKQSPERTPLAEVVRGVVMHRGREAGARGLTLAAPTLAPVEVLVDAPLLFALLNATVDWALANAGPGATIEIALESRGWPVGPRLTCSFGSATPSEGGTERRRDRQGEESLVWWLLEETARVLAVGVDRRMGAELATLSLDFFW